MGKLIVDFGLVILIWMTQLVVYPSFTYYSESNLYGWHQKYTTAISIIVMPLMLSQVAMHGYGLYQSFSLFKLISAILIGLIWINTFFYAVPLHNKIGMNQEVLASAAQLVKVNWFRTISWSVVFLLGLYEFLRNQG